MLPRHGSGTAALNVTVVRGFEHGISSLGFESLTSHTQVRPSKPLGGCRWTDRVPVLHVVVLWIPRIEVRCRIRLSATGSKKLPSVALSLWNVPSTRESDCGVAGPRISHGCSTYHQAWEAACLRPARHETRRCCMPYVILWLSEVKVGMASQAYSAATGACTLHPEAMTSS